MRVHLSQCLAAHPITVHYDVSLPVIVECNASPHGIGASLLHVYPGGSSRPVVFVLRNVTEV